ncbi:MAG: ABC transporter substrate-binding protein [Gammaproteobacteria bacterium]|nr:ABC transporter substrate-binding protein [Gammaproteobacteria bacterium]
MKRSFHEDMGDEVRRRGELVAIQRALRANAVGSRRAPAHEKNPDYWNADEITLNRIDVGYITEDNRTRLNLFQGRPDRAGHGWVRKQYGMPPSSVFGCVRSFPAAWRTLRFNLDKGRLTRDVRIRRAVQAAFDPDEFVNKVIAIPGYRPAYSFFPGWLPGVEEQFLAEYPVEKLPVDYSRARALVDEAIARARLGRRFADVTHRDQSDGREDRGILSGAH